MHLLHLLVQALEWVCSGAFPFSTPFNSLLSFYDVDDEGGLPLLFYRAFAQQVGSAWLTLSYFRCILFSACPFFSGPVECSVLLCISIEPKNEFSI